MRQRKMVRPDEKGRVCLGELAKGVSRFRVSVDEHNRIYLEPYVEIPAREQWLFKNKAVLDQLKEGIDDAAAGRVSDRGSFATFLDEDDN